MPAAKPPAIYCYSHSGHTGRAAAALAVRTGAEIVPVEVDRYRLPILWVIRAIWDVGRWRLPPLRTGNVVPAHRPWIVVACPIWADQPAPPARSVLVRLAGGSAPVGLLTTSGGSAEPVKGLRTCERVLGRSMVAHVNIPNKIDGKPDMDQRLATFADLMMSSPSQGAA